MYEIGKKNNTDKITHHRYHEIYPTFIQKFYQKEGGIVEIGIAREASLKMWLELFPKMHIYGIDINVEKEGPRFNVLKVDQGSEDDLDHFVEQIHHPIIL